jgi:uncharacterized membrane protein
MPETIDAVSPNPYGSNSTNEKDVSSSMTVTHIMYALHALAPFTMWTLAIIAMIIGLVKRDDVRGTWLDSHYEYMSRTFWWGILWAVLAWGAFWVLGVLTLGIGMAVLWILPVIVLVWYLYRVIKGWLRLNENRAVGGIS